MVQLVSPPVWNLPPTAPALVSVAASANQGLSSRDGVVCHWRNVAVWMTRITIMRSDIPVNIPMCIHLWSLQRHNGMTVNEKVALCSSHGIQYTISTDPFLNFVSAWRDCVW